MISTVYFTTPGGVDYTSGGYEVTFPAGSTTATLRINITDDDIPESKESFTASLSTTSERVSVGPAGTATVNIEDNNGKLHYTV